MNHLHCREQGRSFYAANRTGWPPAGRGRTNAAAAGSRATLARETGDRPGGAPLGPVTSGSAKRAGQHHRHRTPLRPRRPRLPAVGLPKDRYSPNGVRRSPRRESTSNARWSATHLGRHASVARADRQARVVPAGPAVASRPAGRRRAVAPAEGWRCRCFKDVPLAPARVVCGRGRNPTFSLPRVTVLRLQDAKTSWPCSRSWP